MANGAKIARAICVLAIASSQACDKAPPVRITSDASMHDFGIVDATTTSATHVFMVTNTSDAPTGAMSLDLEGDETSFIVSSGCEREIPALGACTITVAFRPTTFGARMVRLRLRGASTNTLTVDLAGVGRDQVTLDVASMGDGAGRVTGADIDCPGVCSATLVRTTEAPVVSLDARSATGSSFTGWGGACASAASVDRCDLTLDAGASVTAGFARERFTVRVTLEGVDDATGSVVATPEAPADEVVCTDDCERELPYGLVTLRALPDEGLHFGGWDHPACAPMSRTCTLMLEAPTSIGATFTHANRAFLTEEDYTVAEIKAFATDTSSEAAKMLSGADALCRAIIGGDDVVAWIGSVGESAFDRMPDGARGWARPDGNPFLDELTVDAAPIYPPLITNAGNRVEGIGSQFWTGIDPLGNTTPSSTCDAWAITAGAPMAGAGRALSVSPTTWMSGVSLPCAGGARRLLCLETRYTAQVEPPPPPEVARTAFVTRNAFIPTTGIAGADALCAGEAESAGLEGTFRALLATSVGTMASRFTIDDAPVVRTDGAIVAEAASTLFASGAPIDAPIARDAHGEPLDRLVFARVWTGRDVPTALASASCQDPASGSSWRSNVTGTGLVGDPEDASAWLSAATQPCTGTNVSIYCLEDVE